MSPVFIDTGGWANLFVRTEPFHTQSAEIVRQARLGPGAVTSNYVLAELSALLISPLRSPPQTRRAILEAIRSVGWVKVVHVDPDIDHRSWDYLMSHSDKNYTLADCSSFVIMNDLRSVNALTADKHFEQAGFRRLLRHPA